MQNMQLNVQNIDGITLPNLSGKEYMDFKFTVHIYENFFFIFYKMYIKFIDTHFA